MHSTRLAPPHSSFFHRFSKFFQRLSYPYIVPLPTRTPRGRSERLGESVGVPYGNLRTPPKVRYEAFRPTICFHLTRLPPESYGDKTR